MKKISLRVLTAICLLAFIASNAGSQPYPLVDSALFNAGVSDYQNFTIDHLFGQKGHIAHKGKLYNIQWGTVKDSVTLKDTSGFIMTPVQGTGSYILEGTSQAAQIFNLTASGMMGALDEDLTGESYFTVMIENAYLSFDQTNRYMILPYIDPDMQAFPCKSIDGTISNCLDIYGNFYTWNSISKQKTALLRTISIIINLNGFKCQLIDNDTFYNATYNFNNNCLMLAENGKLPAYAITRNRDLYKVNVYGTPVTLISALPADPDVFALMTGRFKDGSTVKWNPAGYWEKYAPNAKSGDKPISYISRKGTEYSDSAMTQKITSHMFIKGMMPVNGTIAIDSLQRYFVWSKEKSLALVYAPGDTVNPTHCIDVTGNIYNWVNGSKGAYWGYIGYFSNANALTSGTYTPSSGIPFQIIDVPKGGTEGNTIDLYYFYYAQDITPTYVLDPATGKVYNYSATLPNKNNGVAVDNILPITGPSKISGSSTSIQAFHFPSPNSQIKFDFNPHSGILSLKSIGKPGGEITAITNSMGRKIPFIRLNSCSLQIPHDIPDGIYFVTGYDGLRKIKGSLIPLRRL